MKMRKKKRTKMEEEEGAGAPSSWLRPEREPTEEEKSRMFAMAVVAGVMGAMNNHCYRFEQKTRKQKDGGSIGNQESSND